MAGPVTYVTGDMSLEEQLLKKHTEQLLREQTPPWESDEYKERTRRRQQEIKDARELLEQQSEEKLERELAAQREAAHRMAQKREQQRRDQIIHDNRYARHLRRMAFMESYWLRFKIVVYGLFGVSAFQVIWDDRHN